jgi:hypothetical protein
MYRYSYSRLGDLPPIPIAPLFFSNLNPQEPVIFQVFDCILDTGSDCTLLPYSVISRLSPPIPFGRRPKNVQFRGLGDQMMLGVPYRIGIGFEENSIKGCKILACSDDKLENYIIIGRNFLNRYCIKFNGPMYTFEMY